MSEKEGDASWFVCLKFIHVHISRLRGNTKSDKIICSCKSGNLIWYEVPISNWINVFSYMWPPLYPADQLHQFSNVWKKKKFLPHWFWHWKYILVRIPRLAGNVNSARTFRVVFKILIWFEMMSDTIVTHFSSRSVTLNCLIDLIFLKLDFCL